MKPPNLIMAGDIEVAAENSGEMPDTVKFALVIECADAAQVREAIKTGRLEFTVFKHYEPTAQ